jgi:hypothetical protein
MRTPGPLALSFLAALSIGACHSHRIDPPIRGTPIQASAKPIVVSLMWVKHSELVRSLGQDITVAGPQVRTVTERTASDVRKAALPFHFFSFGRLDVNHPFDERVFGSGSPGPIRAVIAESNLPGSRRHAGFGLSVRMSRDDVRHEVAHGAPMVLADVTFVAGYATYLIVSCRPVEWMGTRYTFAALVGIGSCAPTAPAGDVSMRGGSPDSTAPPRPRAPKKDRGGDGALSHDLLHIVFDLSTPSWAP